MGHPGDDGSGGGAGLADLSSMLPTLMMLFARGGERGGTGAGQWLQLVLVLVLPLLLRSMLPKFQAWFNTLKLGRSRASRVISHSLDPSCWWREDENDEEAFNAVIQRAILKYLNTQMPDITKAWMESDIQARKEDKGLDSAAGGSSGSSNDNDSCRDSTITASSTYSHYSYLCAPPNGSWVDLKNGIELERVVSHRTNEGSNRSSRITVTTITLRATHGGVGPSTINAFIDHCVDLYNAELRSKIDTSRYFYTPVLSASSEDKARSGMLYKRYKLSDARSFASFFHPEKATILSLVDQFVNKTGKFSIPGYPLKLGFLLHGPPGTGKTSFIKALAQYTGRHVVNIPLSKIKTNQELMNIMFDQSICIAGAEDNTATSLPFSRVIFVMEDVDAASGVVHRRAPAECGGASATAQQQQAMEAMAMAAAMAAAASAGKGSDGRSGSGDEDRESNDGPRTPGRTPEPGGGAWGTASSVGAGGGGGGGGSEIEMGPVHWKDLLKDSASDNDKLNLASLLNVLDGVIDTPDRIVVLTTNHPEKLDPALIRPGRINRKVYLGNIKLSQAQAMMRHYFNAGSLLDAHTEQRLADVFVDDVMSPAQLESMCAEYECVEELIDQLQAKLQRLAPPPLVAFGSNCLTAGKTV